MPTGWSASTTTAAPCARFGISASASPTVSVGASAIGVSITGCRVLTHATTSATTSDRDVLREHREPAAPREGLGHPPPGHGGHVGRDERHGGPAAVVAVQRDVRPRGDGGATRYEEGVLVGQVVGGGVAVEEAHERPVGRGPGSADRTPAPLSAGGGGAARRPPVEVVGDRGDVRQPRSTRSPATRARSRRARSGARCGRRRRRRAPGAHQAADDGASLPPVGHGVEHRDEVVAAELGAGELRVRAANRSRGVVARASALDAGRRASSHGPPSAAGGSARWSASSTRSSGCRGVRRRQLGGGTVRSAPRRRRRGARPERWRAGSGQAVRHGHLLVALGGRQPPTTDLTGRMRSGHAR
jgi:hypothetical protein